MSTIGDFSPEAYELLREYYGEKLTSVRDQDFHEVAVLGEMETETLTLTAKYLTDPENFSEEELWEFARCQRPDGSFYGTRGTCRKGKPVSADAKDEDMERVKKEEKAAKEKRKDARKKMSGMKPSLREIAKAMDENEEERGVKKEPSDRAKKRRFNKAKKEMSAETLKDSREEVDKLAEKSKKAIEAKRRTKKKSEEAPKPMSLEDMRASTLKDMEASLLKIEKEAEKKAKGNNETTNPFRDNDVAREELENKKRRKSSKSEVDAAKSSQDKKQSEKGRKPKKTKTPAIKDEDVEAALMEMDRDGDISDKTFEKLRQGGRSMTEILEAIENYGIPSKKRGKSNGRKSGK